MGSHTHQLESAEKQYPDAFAVIDNAINYFAEVIHEQGIPQPSSPLAFVRVAAVIRAFNLLKSIRQLLAGNHWENAAILMRSLFELVLNIEEIERDPATAEQQAQSFIRFEAVQQTRRLLAESEYELATGRRTEHDPRLSQLVESLRLLAPQWVRRRDDGTIKWSSSWSGKSVRALCEASGSRVRMGQYDIIYAYGSDMAHSSPRSVLSSFPRGSENDWEALLASAGQTERHEIETVLTLSVTFAFEVVGQAKFLAGAFDAVKVLLIGEGIYKVYGVAPPPRPPEVERILSRARDAKN